MRVQVFYIGKPRNKALNEAAAEYAKRLGRFCRFESVEIKSESEAAGSNKPSKALRVVLDPAGRQMTSDELSRLIEGAGRDVAFYVGGAEGFSDSFRSSADRLLSLSAMTLPHELARLVLVEQVYRAFTILNGHPYPR